MNITDTISMRGIFELAIYRHGQKIEDYRENNLILTATRSAIVQMLAGVGSGEAVKKIGFGSNGTAPVPGNSALANAYIKNVSGHTFPADGQVRFSWSLAASEANGLAITEFGLLTASNTLLARKTRGAIQKESDLALEGSWTLIF